MAKYQGRIVADAILGHSRPANYDGIPRVVFRDPETAAAGITQAQAGEQGLSTAFAELDLAESIARPSTYEQDPRGYLGLLTDTDRGTLIGAWAVSHWPESGSARPPSRSARGAGPPSPITGRR